ncbi:MULTISPECIES: hypothetical protein [Acinetobacter]|uniref:hypothetical protein n=1 Tax=Acinetobacter TaxID=469 RepID=UPI000C68FD5B|nr:MULTISPECIES: hypothetical protein [Acinetobacter]MBC70421.1 hypothetical protein [Acinetobacter sp.]MBT51709.1 hypothetical protein [Acinetobacter sp.]QHI16255.1 hypothetical protein AhaeAN4_06440 [Acinetobacter haemolyticus]QHI17059.1 hypothetical protein AhaeAN4_10915 [Acinetobacter haemolyticus]|tara:strand:- start:628 stop:1014 length:387 start_codon:yes stop_codon:yes gene_type:complete
MDNSLLDYCNEMASITSSYPDLQNRNIVGRAYYHAFHHAKFHLDSRLDWIQTTTKGGVHMQLYSKLKGYDKEVSSITKLNAEKLYSKLNALKKLRTRADYKLESVITKEIANFSIEESKRISELFIEI